MCQTSPSNEPGTAPSAVATPPVRIENTRSDVYRELVENDDDFLGLLAYSLYKRHKIEWLRSHPDENHEAFKRVACTPQQVRMYHDQATQMARNMINESLDQLGEELRESITDGLSSPGSTA